MPPSQFQCRRCWVAPGHACVNPDGSTLIVSGNPWFHAERYEDADSSISGGNISKEEFGEAVVNSGLV